MDGGVFGAIGLIERRAKPSEERAIKGRVGLGVMGEG